MDVLGDLIARDRRSKSPALRAPAVGRDYDYRRFCTAAWKVGNFLRHLGVRGGATVAVADDPLPEPVLTLYGAAALGGVVRFDPPAAADEDPRALVVPEPAMNGHAVAPRTNPVVYGDPPADPAVAYFERDVWSENPTAPPDRVRSDDPVLRTDRATYTHGDVLEAARSVRASHGVDADATVAVTDAASFADPGTVVAGLVTPILAGGTVELGPGATGDLVVGGPESDVDLATVL